MSSDAFPLWLPNPLKRSLRTRKLPIKPVRRHPPPSCGLLERRAPRKGGRIIRLLISGVRAPPLGLPVNQGNYPVQFSPVPVVSNSLRLHEAQHARPPCPSPAPRVYTNSCPSNRRCHPTISFSSPPALNPSQYQGLFKGVSSSHQVAKVLEFQLQHQSLQ